MFQEDLLGLCSLSESRGLSELQSLRSDLQAVLDQTFGPRDQIAPVAALDDEAPISLPDYPGSHDPNCTCTWVISDSYDRTEATWQLDEAKPCTNKRCRENAARWNPLVLRKSP
jgi:hypothetical protein